MEEKKFCVALTFESLWWLPGLQRHVWRDAVIRVEGWPDDAVHVENNGYSPCGLPGEIWDEHADGHDDRPGWLCRFHASAQQSPHNPERWDTSGVPSITLNQLLDPGHIPESYLAY